MSIKKDGRSSGPRSIGPRRAGWCRAGLRLISLLLAALALTSCGLFSRPAKRPEPAVPQPPQAETNSPLNPTQLPDYEGLKAQVQGLLQNKQGVYGVYVEDLPTGMRWGIRQDRAFVAASTIKVPLVLYLYRQAQAGKVDLEETVAVALDDYEPGTGLLQSEPVGKRYSLRQLARLALVESDNVATNMLIRYLGRASFRAYVRSLGTFISPDHENVTSPRDMAFFFKVLLDFKEEAPDLGGEILDALLHSRFSDRLPALLPKDVPVAHKIGNQMRVVNDAGVVFLPRHPYVISVFSEDVNEGEATKAIAQISKLVFNYQSSLR